MNPWIQTRSGERYDLLAPDARSITLGDVAHALAHIGRYTGHARTLYTVAQHSVLGARQLAHEGHSAGVQKSFLLHDAHEAYTGDIASPIKACIGVAWHDFERRHEIAVRVRFGAPRDLPVAVKHMDLRMLMTEFRDLMEKSPAPLGVSAEPISDLRIKRCWSPSEARGEFLEECYRLGVT